MKNTFILIIAWAANLCLSAQPTDITWQGKLLDADGNAITQNNVALTFVIFDSETAGNQLWPTSGVVAKVVNVVNGLYSLQLGTGAGDDIAFTAAMFAGKTPWLEVKVGTETLPRTIITNVPFALISNELSDSGWENPGEIGKTTPNTGKFTTLETGELKVTTGAADGKVLTSDGEGNTSWETPYTGLTNFTESNFTYDSKTGVKFTPNSAATNVDIILQPKGTGAILAQQPDGTEAGGNNRGTYAVDFQHSRGEASQVASGIGSAILGGTGNTASGYVSTALGFNTMSSAMVSTAMGYYTKASGNYSTAMGRQTTASGDISTAMGFQTTASGVFSTAMGFETTASGVYSIAMGKDAAASNEYAVAIGNNPVASGYASLAMGDYTTASGRISTAFGNRTIAPSAYETVLGRYNSDYTPSSTTDWIATDRLVVVGNGASDVTKSNALTILKSGNTGIGTDAPTQKLEVNGNVFIPAGSSYWIGSAGDAGNRLRLHQTGSNAYIDWGEETLFFRSGVDAASSKVVFTGDGKVGIGTTAPKAQLDLGNGISNRKIALYTAADNDHQFTGFGLNNDALRFQLGNTTGNFKFYGATSATTSTELFSIQGDGNVVAQGQIKNVTNPTDAQDAATKAYVDALKTQLTVLEDMLIETGAYKIFDADSNIYHVVRIGNQLWMNENLKTTKYNDNTEIPMVTDATEWAGLTTPAYAWYGNNFETYGAVYGALYNFYVVDTAVNGHKNICPVGWHVPSITEWNTLFNFLGGVSIAGGKLKSTRTDPDAHPRWNSPNTGATDQFGFNALPGGDRYYTNGQFAYLGGRGYWWSSTKYTDTKSWTPGMSTNGPDVINYGSYYTFGFSVRCIRD